MVSKVEPKTTNIIPSEIIANTIVMAHSLRDNIEILEENGLLARRLKFTAKQFHSELDRFLETVYKKIEGDDMNWMIKAIDIDSEIMAKVAKLKIEDKVDLLKKL